ncbi:hypothetical protein KKC87_02260, partial [Patescibacteria group bacterium]|nr:hypothetical protein [Patescibacteria group bacterium]
ELTKDEKEMEVIKERAQKSLPNSEALKGSIDALTKIMQDKALDTPEKQAKAAAEFNQNPINATAFKMMFGDQKIDEVIRDKKQVAVLEKISKKLEDQKGDLKDKKGQELLGAVRKSFSDDVQGESVKVKEQKEIVARAAVVKDPSLFAARSKAEYDHEYSFYRGHKKASEDAAGQDRIWKQHGITTPTASVNESVVDEIHGKVFKGMNYEQTVAAHKAFLKNIEKKKTVARAKVPSEEYEPSASETMISHALLVQLASESWVDDGGKTIGDAEIQKLQSEVLDAIGVKEKEKRKGLLDSMNKIGNRKHANIEVPKLAQSQIAELRNFCKPNVGGADVDWSSLINSIRTDNKSVLNDFEQTQLTKIGEALQNSQQMKGMGIDSWEKLKGFLGKQERNESVDFVSKLEKAK